MAILFVQGIGCNLSSDSSPTAPQGLVDLTSNEISVSGRSILGQGRLEPAAGVVSVTAAPGDQIRELFVHEGDAIEIGKLLVELGTLEIREAEIRAAEAKRLEVQQRISVAKSNALAQFNAAEIQLKIARLTRAQADSGQRRLSQVDRELAEAKRVMVELRVAATDPDVAALIGTATLNQQELAVQGAEQERILKALDAKSAVQSADLAVVAAEQEVEAAKVALEAADGSAQVAAMDAELHVLHLQLNASRIVSPIDGTVVSVLGSVGQMTGVTPIMQIANTQEMVCMTEIDVADLNRIDVGNVAKMKSPALEKTLKGKVKSISQVVGVPRLPDPNPMARTDWRAAIIEILIDDDSCEMAAGRINLQVEVEITARKPAEQTFRNGTDTSAE